MRCLFSMLLLPLISPFLFAQQPAHKVVTTTSVFSDITRTLAVNFVQLETIVPMGENPQTYQPKTEDLHKLAEADLILYNGLGLEPWLETLMEDAKMSATFIQVSEGVEVVENIPQAWMNAQNGIVYAENIANALINLDPENGQVYEFNFGVYQQQLQDLDQSIQDEINTLPEEKRALVTTIDALHYYAKAYNLKIRTPVNEEETLGGNLYIHSLSEMEGAAPTYYDLLYYDTELIMDYLVQEEQLFEESRNPTGWNNYWLLGSIILIIISIVAFWIIRRRNKIVS